MNSIIELEQVDINCISGGFSRREMAWKEVDDQDDDKLKNDPVRAAVGFGIMILIATIGLISIVMEQKKELDAHKQGNDSRKSSSARS